MPFPGALPDSGTEPESPASQADSLLLSHQGRVLVNLKENVRSDDQQGLLINVKVYVL